MSDNAKTDPVAMAPEGARAHRMRELYRGSLSKRTRTDPHADIVLGSFCRPAVELGLSWTPPTYEEGHLDEKHEIMGLRLVPEAGSGVSALVSSFTLGRFDELYPETRYRRWLQMMPGLLYPVSGPMFVIAPNGVSATVVCQLDPSRSLAIEILTISTEIVTIRATPTTGRTS